MSTSKNTGNPQSIVILHNSLTVGALIFGAVLFVLGASGAFMTAQTHPATTAFLICSGVAMMLGSFGLWKYRATR